MSVYKRGTVWWYKFTFNGEPIRESTKQGNKRVAEQMEAAHKTALAKGEVGIRERTPAPTLKVFATRDFLPFVQATKADQPNTRRFYENSVQNLLADERLAKLPLDKIATDQIGEFIALRREDDVEISTINRDLATLRRMFHLAMEWKKVAVLLPRVKMLPGENRRERVLTADEETRYLEAARSRPLAHDVATLILDCGLRPEECFRLQWEIIRDGFIEIHKGKGRGSRRRIPIPPRSAEVLERRRSATAEWVFPAPTKTGHISDSSVKKQHAAAIKESKVTKFVFHELRHTAITRWAPHMDPFTLHVLAGHTNMATTLLYVHPNETHIRESMEKARGGHKSGHNKQKAPDDQGS